MAVRRDVLVGLGGFDATYRYYLDDTDLNMRLARAGHQTAIAPNARVWHRQDMSERRGPARVPRRLHEIGASLSAFLARFSEHPAHDLARHRETEKRRLLRHLVQGNLEPRDIRHRLKEFDQGADEGRSRPPDVADHLSDPRSEFRPIRDVAPRHDMQVISGWVWQPLWDRAVEAMAEGSCVHLIRLSPTTLYHHRKFVEPGIWVQTGGVFGRSRRDGPLIQWSQLGNRAREESENGPIGFI